MTTSNSCRRSAPVFTGLALCAAFALPYGVEAQTRSETNAAQNPPAGSVAAQNASARPQKSVSNAPAAGANVAAADPATATARPARPPSTPVCTGDFAPTAHVSLPEGKSGLLDLPKLNLPSPAWLRTLGDPELLQVEPMTSQNPRGMFFLFGKKVGATNLMFQDRDGRCAMVEVSVGVDTAAVQAKLNQLMPNEKGIRIEAAADSLVLSGTVSDAIAADKILSIAQAYVRRSGMQQAGMQPAAAPAGAGMGGMTNTGAGMDRIVNMLSIAAPQQVMLEVKVAEISKTLLDQLGVGVTASTTRGSWAASLATGFLTGSNGLLSFAKSSGERITLDAEKRDGLVKILAEPTIMAISGQEGSFLAGGKIFIPVAQSNVGTGITISLEEKEFGVGLRFTPTVLDGGRINLKVAPEVSELSREGVGIQATGTSAGNAVLPLITTRRAATTVQLYDGQSFAIGGLIKSNAVQNIKALPVLGEVPVLGALFRSSDFQTDRTELVFIVTPRLAKALPPNYALPTDKYMPPSRAEFFLGGKMEGTAPQAGTPSGFEIK